MDTNAKNGALPAPRVPTPARPQRRTEPPRDSGREPDAGRHPDDPGVLEFASWLRLLSRPSA